MSGPEKHSSQFSLLTNRRFLPFFLTQYLGAFNDNIYKNALMGMVTYGVLQASLDLNQMNNLGALLFILPFFLFSALAGQLADKYDKAWLMRRIKLAEIAIMSAGAAAFFFEHTWGLMILLFLMGSQSAFFGPAKYGIIPQHLKDEELVGGNALIETGTFLAILTGTMTAGVISTTENSILLTSFFVLALSVAGYLASRQIPPAPSSNPDLKIDFNPITSSWYTLGFARRNPSVFIGTLAIAWFWFIGAANLTQLFVFTKDYLYGDQSVVTLLLTMFSVGIAVGSLMCNRLSGGRLELGLVPLGAIGLTLAGIDLYFYPLPTHGTELISVGEFMAAPSSWKIVADFLVLGACGGFYIVPVFTMVQKRGEAAHLSRIIAAGAILSALAMVGSAIFGLVIISTLHWTIPEFFLLLALINAVVCLLLFRAMPEMWHRFLIWSRLRPGYHPAE